MSEPEACIGIRREDKSKWERRVPLTPEHVETIVAGGTAVCVQPSPIRVFPDDAYRAVGAAVSEDLSGCSLVLGVKEMPSAIFAAGRTYMFFSHTIKGQPHNMPMLRALLRQGATLVDYERVTEASGRRLVFFGRHAGLAGAVETLRALGARLATEGIATPFAALRSAYEYGEVDEARRAMAAVRKAIDEGGLPEAVRPLVIGVAGYGNVAGGVQDMLRPLGPIEVAPEAIGGLDARDPRALYVTTFREEHLVAPRAAGAKFVLQEYYDQPERYVSRFEPYLEHLTVLVNAIYWAPRYPRLVTKDAVRRMWGGAARPRLRVLGDITCDIDGSIECTVRATEPDRPVFTWNPRTGEATGGVAGEGPVVMAVDILPCEFPREASHDFGEALSPFVGALARADFSRGLDKAGLPEEIARAVIAVRGELAPAYAYLREAVGLEGS